MRVSPTFGPHKPPTRRGSLKVFTDRRANSLKARRTRQPWPKDRPFKLLALDGGGIKGIYTAELLRHCQDAFGNGRPIARYFDMIAGTSTGGIIALGLGLDLAAEDIVAFYREDGKRIFPPLPTQFLKRGWNVFRWLRGAKLDHDALENALKTRFGNNLLGDASARLVIPAFMMPKTEIAVFKTDHHADFKEDWRTPMWMVARATSAAPTYLKGLTHAESGKVFLDGGVWANNPVMVALVDALTDYDLSPDQIRVLSIGTGNAPFELSLSEVFGGLVSWKAIIKAAMYLTTDNATAQAQLLLGPDQCLRLEPDGADGVVELDDYVTAMARLPQRAEIDFRANQMKLAEFFASATVPRERHHRPLA